jgi:hypothetical protein
MAAKKFPDKSPGEAKLCTFDFTGEAAAASVLSGPTAFKELVEGNDVGAAALTLGIPGVEVGTKRVKVLVSAGNDENKYRVKIRVNADNQEIHELAATMNVKESAA